MAYSIRKRIGGKEMNFDLPAISSGAIVIVPIVVAIVQALKLTNWFSDKFAPLISIAVGVIISFIAGHQTYDMSNNMLSGVMYGLMASGLYSGVKTTLKADEANK